MSFAQFQAVLSSNHTKSSTRFAHALLAIHGCPTCGRVYCGVDRLARELNIHASKVKVLPKKLREAELIKRTGEVGPHGVTVYWLM